MKKQILENLNKQQKEAVLIKNKPVLVLAGAGSGKTRTIVHRIAYILMNGNVSPENILAVTFTNKAADELRERIHKFVGPKAANIWIRTFHSTCSRILRTSGYKIGLSGNFTIIDEEESKSIIKSILKDMNIDPKDYPVPMFISSISGAKENLIGPDKYLEFASDGDRKKRIVSEVYPAYDKILRSKNYVDFDDLIMLSILILRENPDILDYYNKLWKHVLIDEFQDTNFAQYVFTKLISVNNNNLYVVGDEDQSIYSWRGANIENVLGFKNDFPDVEIIRLEQNYRSTNNIISAASGVISNNSMRIGKSLWTKNEKGERISLFQVDDETEEAAFIVGYIKRLKHYKYKLNDMAVFYRVNSQSRILEEYLRRENIPYSIIGGTPFYRRKEIKDIIAYLRMINNPDDDEALKRIINIPLRGIGQVTLNKLIKYSSQNKVSLYDTLKVDKNNKKLLSFHELIEKFKKNNDKEKISQLINQIILNIGYMDYLNTLIQFDPEERKENVKELITSIKSIEKRNPEITLNTYLDDISLYNSLDSWNNSTDRLVLMTLHNAKGLEFPVVIIIGNEEELLPHINSLDYPDRLEEERRLFYVGLTRAKKKVILTTASQRNVFGKRLFRKISRFVTEIPAECFI